MQNVVNKNKMLMLCLIVFLVILMAVAIIITSATGAVASADSSATSVYKQAVGSYETDLNYVQDDRITEFDSKGANWLSSFSSDYSSFEYIVELGSSNEVLCSSFMLRSLDYKDCLGFGIIENDSKCKVVCLLGDFNAHPSKPYYEEEFFISDSLASGDFLYFTFNSERAFFSWFSQYDSPSYGKSEYDMSLEHIFLSFEVGSDWYNSLRYIVFNQTETPKISIETQTSDNSVVLPGESPVGRCYYKEQITFYKNIEAPVKEGYTFTGWYYDEACTRPYKGEPIDSDVNLYAGWKINTYNVTFDCSILDDSSDPNNVGFYNKTEQYNYGDIIDYVPEPMVGNNYYWVIEDGTRYDNTTPIKSDMTLYLRSMCRLTFELPGIDEVIDLMTVEYGAIVDLPKPENTPDRHGFSNWECPDVPSWNEEIPVTSDMNLIAVWYRNVFTVTFYVDNEVFKQIDVALGSTLGVVSKDLGVNTDIVVGYGYCNISTSSTNYEDLEVIDDVVVYLSESFDIDDNTPGEIEENATGIKDKFVKFGNDVKAFFVRVGQFFKTYWKITVGAICGVVVLAIVIAIIVKRR